MRKVRVFISSPSDASRERDRLARVARRLNIIYSEVVDLEIIRWEDDFYSAHETFQTQIPEAKTCDIVIGILKHRLGSPLPASFPRMPEGEPFFGEPYPSGTAYEILSSIARRLLEGSDTPDIYVFRDAEPPVVTLGSTELERVDGEWRRLEDFARRFFFTAEGDFRFAFQTFRSASQFEQQIETLLRRWIEANVYDEHRSIWPVHLRGSPFRALDVFDFAHRDVFFGRDRDTARAIDLLAETATEAELEGSERLPFLLITGPSGSGKSSLLRAGVAPGLVATDIGDTEQWRLAVITPAGSGKGPFENLAEALLGGERSKDGGAADERPPALPELREGPFSTPETLARLLAHGDASAALVVADAISRLEKDLAARENFEKPPRVRLLLVVDQLDDVFSGSIAEDDVRAFAALLTELARTNRVWIAASLRAGLFENLLSHPGFSSLRGAGVTHELGPPAAPDLADIVRKPAQAADIAFEKDPATGLMLDDVLLADFDRPDMLPLLQFTLEALFVRRQTRDGVILLTHSAYTAMNGIAGAIETTANAALSALAEAERRMVPALLRRLVRSGHTGDGEAPALTLRAVDASELEAIPHMQPLLVALTEARLLVAGGLSTETRTYRIAHQRLLSLWPEAEAALRENATFFRVSEELEQAYRRFDRSGRRSAQLIRDPVLLSEGIRLVETYPGELSPGIEDFVRRSRLRARLGTIVLASSAAVFALLFIGTIWFYQRASLAEARALEQKEMAEANFKLAERTLQGTISSIADGLRNVEGMSIANRREILGQVAASVDDLQRRAPDLHALDDIRRSMFDSFGETYAAGGDAENALKSYENVLTLNRAMLMKAQGAERQEIERGIAVALGRIADLLVSQGKRDQAKVSYDKALEIRQSLLEADPDNATLKRDLAISFDRLGQFLTASGDVDGARRLFDEGAEQSRKIVAGSPESKQARRDLSVSLEHIFDLELLRGNRAAVADLIDEIVEIRETLAEEQPNDTLATEDLITAILKKADWQRSAQDLEKAGQTFSRARDLAKRLVSSDPEKIAWQRQLATVTNSLADIAMAKGNYGAARAGYGDALERSRKTAAIAPGNAGLQFDIAYSLNRLGDAEKAAGRLKEALLAYKEALPIARKLAAGESGNVSRQWDVAHSLSRIADTQLATGDRTSARRNFGDLVDVLNKVVASAPQNLPWKNDLSLYQARVAELDFADGRLAEAREGFEGAIETLRALVAADATNTVWRQTLAVRLNQLGDTQLRLKAPEAAAASYKDALGIIEAMLADDPQNRGLKWDMAYCLQRIGSVALQGQDRATALTNFERGLTYVRDIAAAHPDDPRAQIDLVISLMTIADVQDREAKIASLREALDLAGRLKSAGQLTGPAAGLDDTVRTALDKAAADKG